MSQSFHSAVSSLLCVEDSGSVFSEEVDSVRNEFLGDEVGDNWFLMDHQQILWESLTGLPVHMEDCLVSMIRRESEHMPAGDYLNRLRSGNLDVEARVQALDWIFKVRSFDS